MSEACIFNIQRYSLHDGGGIRTIVFFKGCPFQCPWCCNPESLSPQPQLFYKEILCMNCSKKIDGMCETRPRDCPTGAKEIVGEMKTVEEVFDVVKRDRIFYESSNGGVTLSGGEFLLQQEFALELLKKCKEEHLHTAVETTLALPILNMQEFIDNVDVFLVDFKLMNEETSQKLLRLDVKLMLDNVKEVLHLGGKVISRIPLIPNYTATDENLRKIIEILKVYQLKEIHLLPFHQLGAGKYQSIDKPYLLEDLKTFSEDEIIKIENVFKKEGFKTIVHGT